MVQVFIDEHPELFQTGLERADLKLFLLCAVLGLTGWAGLCRLLRAETLKLREFDYVQAAQAFGVGSARIMTRHVFPNVAHLMLIVTVLDFSSLILYEAVLSYVGVGVDPSMNSFGGMINLARNEMSRDPIIWWPFASAFFFMVALVLAANLFADGVRDAFDPRARSFRVQRVAVPEAAMRAVRGGRSGMIFQEPSTSLSPVMRVGDQIVEAIEAHTALRGDAARAKAIEWLRRVGIPDPEARIDEYPFRLS